MAVVDHVHAVRLPTGMMHLTLMLSDPARLMDPSMVHALGNILLDCLANQSITALMWSISVAVGAARRVAAGDA